MIKKCFSVLVILIFELLPQPGHALLTSFGLDKDKYTSDFLIGSVVVAVIFIESNGTLDIDKETWSDDRKGQALSEIMSGLDWWTKQNPNSPLSFTFVSETVETKYEPINRPYYDEALWIPDALKKSKLINTPLVGDRFSATRTLVNGLRTKYNTDWGYVIYVIDSLNDTNGKFSDGLFAYAYLGGPFMVMTYDNNGYGIGNMDVVAAHETGHIFHALDQYAGASGPNDYSRGYFPTINGNHAYSSQANDPNSVMRGGIKWGLDNWSRSMIGWKDADGNGKDDIFERSPGKTINSQPTSSSAPPGSAGFAGRANVTIYPRQNNSLGHGLTVDTVAKVEYKLENGDWRAATALDGAFDEPEEDYAITIPPSAFPASKGTLSVQDVDVRVVTSFSTKSGLNSSGGGSGGTPTDLSNAHPYPNPFKPNSDTSHSLVNFCDLTPGAKVQIFTLSGEAVTSLMADSSSTSLSWNGVDDSGKELASGVYLYLITNSEGQKKEGKIAVIR